MKRREEPELLRSLQLDRDVLKKGPPRTLVMHRTHIWVHVPDHHDDPILAAIQAVHPVVVAAVPRDHLASAPRIRLVGYHQLGPLKVTCEAEVDVQDIVCWAAVHLHISAWLHPNHHDLFILVGCPWQARLRRQPLLQQCASLWEHPLALLRELPPVIQQHVVPLALLVEEAVGVLEAALGLVPQGRLGLLQDRGEGVLQLLANRQVVPRLAAPHGHAAKPADDDLRRVREVVPGHSLARAVRPLGALPRHGRDPAVHVHGFLQHASVLVLQDRYLGV
mmetsp:Transcript_97911/g.258611  ORF Transcript_97911/g.258611 Transcript_97911/m.258611 type:complete len:278 (+) Transcript_97911:240-1073(+)